MEGREQAFASNVQPRIHSHKIHILKSQKNGVHSHQNVLDLLPLAIKLALLGPVTFHVAVDMDLDHLIGREEPVSDALLQGIVVNGGPKYPMLETYSVSFGVAVIPICVADEKYSRISRQARPHCRDGGLQLLANRAFVQLYAEHL